MRGESSPRNEISHVKCAEIKTNCVKIEYAIYSRFSISFTSGNSLCALK